MFGKLVGERASAFDKRQAEENDDSEIESSQPAWQPNARRANSNETCSLLPKRVYRRLLSIYESETFLVTSQLHFYLDNHARIQNFWVSWI